MKERKGKERKGREGKGREGKGKERERKGEEGKGRERKGNDQLRFSLHGRCLLSARPAGSLLPIDHDLYLPGRSGHLASVFGVLQFPQVVRNALCEFCPCPVDLDIDRAWLAWRAGAEDGLHLAFKNAGIISHPG